MSAPSGCRDGLLYFDHAASAPRREEVTDAMTPWLHGVIGNPTGAHAASRAARRALEDAREEVAALTGSIPGGVVFTGGGTESCNLAVFGVAADCARRGRRPRLVVSSIEHHAVLDSAQRLSGGLLAAPADVSEIPVASDGTVDLEALDELATGADLVSVMTANNEVGVVQPVPEVARRVRACAERAVVHSDAVAAAPWLDLAVATEGADLITICGHKLGGPIGIGALCFRRELPLAPLTVGGGQERGRRGGTQDVAAAVGLAAALRCAAAERATSCALTAARRDHLQKLLEGIDGVVTTSPDATRLPGTCHVTVDGVVGEELVFLCDESELCASAGSSCSSGATAPSHVLAAIGMTPTRARSALRLTIGADTTDDDVERAASIVLAAIGRLREGAEPR